MQSPTSIILDKISYFYIIGILLFWRWCTCTSILCRTLELNFSLLLLGNIFCNALNISQECSIDDGSDEEEPPSKSSKDKKEKGSDGKGANLVFKITSKVQYKTVLKGTFCMCNFCNPFLCFSLCKPTCQCKLKF